MLSSKESNASHCEVQSKKTPLRSGLLLIGVLVYFSVGCVSSNQKLSVSVGNPLSSKAKSTGHKLLMDLYNPKRSLLSSALHVKQSVKKRVVRVAKHSEKTKKKDKTYTLDELLQRAYRRSPALREAHYKLVSMKERKAEAFWASWWPQGSLTGVVAPAPPARGDAVKTTTPYPAAFTRLSEYGILTRVDLNLAWPLYTFGKLSLLQDAAQAGVKLGESNMELAKSKWTLLVKKVFYGLQFAESSLELLEEMEEYISDAKKKIKDKTDRLKVIVLEADLKARKVQAELGYNLAVSGLSKLAGVPVKPAIELAQPVLVEPTFSLGKLNDYQKLAQKHRPEIRLLNHAVQAKRALLQAQQRMWLPDFFIGAFFRFGYSSVADDQFSPFARDDFNYLESGVVLGLRFTLDVPFKLATARRAEAEFEAFKSRRALAVHGIKLQIEQHYRGLRAAWQIMNIQKQAKKAANKWITRTMISFSSGLVSVREVSDALLASAKTRFSYIQSMHNAWLTAAKLSRAVGTDVTKIKKNKKN